MAKAKRAGRGKSRGHAAAPGRPAVVIRAATAKDLGAIGGLWKELSLFHARLDNAFKTKRTAAAAFTKHLRESLAKDDTRVAVAQRAGKVIGYCLTRVEVLPPVFTRKKVGHIIDMCVTAGCRRRGAGHMLFDDACRWLASQGVARVEVTFADVNEVSTRFWTGLGFIPFTQRRYLDIGK